MQYVDVILPLALPGLLTYAVPPEHAGTVRVGSRVVVPLRGKRLHTAVVRAIHGQAPGHRTEAFVSLLDAEPLLSEATLRFWDWMSGHYCCSPGEVALAALPAGMRLASETKLQPAPDAEERDDSGLDDREFQVVEALQLRGAMTFREVGDLLGVKDPAPVLRSLVETGWILSNEDEERSRSKGRVHGAPFGAGGGRRGLARRTTGCLGCQGARPIAGDDGPA